MPALALCEYFINRHNDSTVHYAGMPGSMEQKLAGRAGLKFVSIHSASMKKGILSKISFFIKIPFGFLQSLVYLITFKPDHIVGFGGYTCFPLLFAGIILRRNVTVHESNAVPGKVVRFLVKRGAKFAYSLVTANAKMRELIKFAEKKSCACKTGTPVRKSIINASDISGFELTGFMPEKPVIIIIGGSQGSRSLNTTVVDGICMIKKNIPDIQVIHITGKNKQDKVKEKYDACGINNYVAPFTDNIGVIYKIADVAVTRAGALTVSELTVLGLPAILIPFPYATDNHQEENAGTMENAGSAKVICEDKLTPEIISDKLTEIIMNKNVREEMSESAFSISQPDADKLLCDFIENNE